MPDVSVVMSVFNGAGEIEPTLSSVLSQEGCDLEFIVVDDGSTDETGRLLGEWTARDGRLRIIRQQNTGLTRALVRGCAEARGDFIARQDVGDVSLPGRLKRQAGMLRERTDCVAVSCYTEFVGPAGEPLYTAEIPEDRLNLTLFSTDPGVISGPAGHGSVMMRRRDYLAVGGYRSSFFYAQDLDLWTRLVERGRFGMVPEVLFRVRVTPESISGMWAKEQRKLKAIVAKAGSARRSGQDEAPWLDAAAKVRKKAGTSHASRMARGYYFIGSCLRGRDPVAASRYFREAVAHDPLHLKAWIGLARARRIPAS